MSWLGIALGALIGLSLGLLGGGGSILTVPIFVYVVGLDPKPAIAMSLAVVSTTSLFGAAEHWRAGNVNLRMALIFGMVAMVGSYIGARLSALVSGAAQLTLFAVVMLAAAFFMFRPGPEARFGSGPPAAVVRTPLFFIALQGIGVGTLTGLVGVGGGFLIVPALVLLGRVPMKQAIGTSLLIIALNAAAGFAGYLGRVEIRWTFMAAFTGVAVMGIAVGARLVRFVSAESLRRAFAVFLVVMAAFILYENRETFLPGGTELPPASEAGASSAAAAGVG